MVHHAPQNSDGGWTALRGELITNAGGVCSRCGKTGADTVMQGWVDDVLVAAHTRCAVGLGPPVDAPRPLPERPLIRRNAQVRCIAYPQAWVGEVLEVRDIFVDGQPQPGADVRWPDAHVEGWFPLSMLRV
jgi:hypothetical protein